MPYRYNYGALMSANATNNNFKPLSAVAGTADHTNMATALLEAKGLTVGTAETDAVLANLPAVTNDSQVTGFQNIANLTEAQTAEARGDTWGGSDDTMGKSWLEAIVAGTATVSGNSMLDQVNELYEQGFNRAADASGLLYHVGEMGKGSTIQDVARAFLASEESNIRTSYHDAYGRDADAAGLQYWMDHTGQADYAGAGTASHKDFDASDMFKRIVADSSTAETNVRQKLSDELGIHSSDAQRNADSSLDTDGDGVADIFTDASETDVYRMMASGDLGAQEIADKVKMQTAAKSMGDYGGGDQDVGATNIHRMLSNAEMGSVDSTGKWVSDATTLAKTSADYLPQVTTDADGNVTESNVWSLLKSGTQDYNQDDVDDVDDGNDDTDDTDDTDDGTGDDDIVVTNEDVNYMPELTSDVEDTSSYGASKDAFDNAAAGIDAPLQDMMIRNAATGNVGGSAEGVRLKRSKKFKSGETALGTKQLGRQLQLKSLNI